MHRHTHGCPNRQRLLCEITPKINVLVKKKKTQRYVITLKNTPPPHTPPNPLRVSQLPKQVHSILISAIFPHTHGPRKYPVRQRARLFAASANSNRTGTPTRAKPPLRKLSGNFQSRRESMRFGAAARNRRREASRSGIFSRRLAEEVRFGPPSARLKLVLREFLELPVLIENSEFTHVLR